ncbi:50S ribosomal protein L31 [candidate division WWE3 bacterium RBG_13_37_7]|uniref:Large ribosomal subunit protein bL31 n=1 Tax=candidate division WWE3 bacterium RBG_13_37_7 TaxID=1802609 RepID=A0A1F4U144_UNCKA|nr:MAG: 50S ribosomal protein L31 [candidate division WWE3 bacterium RBG_13_37_7]
MKKDIQPKLYKDCKVTCACGNTFVTISTLPSIMVDICSACHPFYTGQQKFVDTEGRIQKFQKKAKAMEERKKVTESKRKEKAGKLNKENKGNGKQPTLKELLETTDKA